MKRIRLRPKNPNPLFESWLEEWRKEAASRNSNLQYYFSKALGSLKKYPLPLKSGKDCIILQHFGTKLCLMLDRKLKEYKAENEGATAKDLIWNHDEQHIPKRKCKSQENLANVNVIHGETELAVFNDLNLPLWNLEHYAILLLLYKHTLDPYSSGYNTEADLLSEVQRLCGPPTETIFSDILDYGLISMMESPIRYNLTQSGINISTKICEITCTEIKAINSTSVLSNIQTCMKQLLTQNLDFMENIGNSNKGSKIQTSNNSYENVYNDDSHKQLRFYKSKSAGAITIEKHVEQLDKHPVKQKPNINSKAVQKGIDKSSKANAINNCVYNKVDDKKNSTDKVQENICLQSGTFDVILLVDKQEISGGKTKLEHDATIVELSNLCVLFEVRHLKVGDFAWIARCRRTNAELILPYIVERKRIDDLSASITDGRFQEQKFRLKQCGIKNLMYIIEEYDKGQRLTIPHSALMQASINTLVQDGFSVKYTENHKRSMFYLSSVTRILIKLFKDKQLAGCKKDLVEKMDDLSATYNLMTFEEFNKAASKQKVFQVSQMFVRQLLQLNGLSIEKALAIVERYPTPRLLIEAFKNCHTDAALLLADIEFGGKKRSIGPVISKTIYQLYTKKSLS